MTVRLRWLTALLLAGGLLAVPVGTPADDKKEDTPPANQEKLAEPDPVLERSTTAYKTADFGRENKSPEALLAAAVMLRSLKGAKKEAITEQPTDENDKPVAQETKQSDAEHCRDHNVVSVKQIRIVQQVTEPAPYSENLRNHHKHPGYPHRQSGTGQNRRQRCRKDDAREKLAFVGTHHHCGLIERDVELTDAMRGIDSSREKRTKTDQEHGRCISDAEKDQR